MSRDVRISITGMSAVSPARTIIGPEPPMTAISVIPGSTSPTQFTGSSRSVPEPSTPPSHATGPVWVNANGVAKERFPATSICRTSTLFSRAVGTYVSPHVFPPSPEYSTRAFASTPESVGMPLSASIAVTSGAIGATVSSVKSRVATFDTLPARSVWRTWTTFEPSTGSYDGPHASLPDAAYSTVAPLSMEPRASVPSLVVPSVALAPVSCSREISGVATVVSRVKVIVVGSDANPGVCCTVTPFATFQVNHPPASYSETDHFAKNEEWASILP